LDHAYHNLAWAGEGLTAVGHEHVIQHQDVACLPGKDDCLLPVRGADVFEGFILDGRAVAGVGSACPTGEGTLPGSLGDPAGTSGRLVRHADVPVRQAGQMRSNLRCRPIRARRVRLTRLERAQFATDPAGGSNHGEA